MNLERQIAGLSLRAWGLVLNFAGNCLLMHGAIQYLTAGAPIHEMAAGIVVTGACAVVLSLPNR
jgi:hypothetical protein